MRSLVSSGRPRRGGRGAALPVVAAVLLAGCKDPTAGPGRLSGSHPPLPAYRAERAAGPVTVDGLLDEAAWAGAKPVQLVDSRTGGAPRYPTEVRLLWDDAALYVAFSCEDDEVWVKPGRTDDTAIYEDEVVEMFLDPSNVGRDYAEIEVSPANVLFDARFARRRASLPLSLAWRSGARTAVHVDGSITVGDSRPLPARGWTVEVALPWAALGLHPRGGEHWRMNLYRLETHNGSRVTEGSAFSAPLGPDFHALERFAWLELAP